MVTFGEGFELYKIPNGAGLIGAERHSEDDHFILTFKNKEVLVYNRGELQLCEQPDVTFVGEEGIDAKGLTKELAYMIVKGLREGNKDYILFEGQANHLLPIHCEEHVQSKLFVYAGQLIAFAFLHGHIGFPGMSRALAKYIVSEDLKDAVPHICIKDIPDINTRLLVKELYVVLFLYWFYSHVLSLNFPQEAPDLMKYAEVVRDLAAGGANWRFYDTQFRSLRQTRAHEMPWGTTH
ncbi:G2 M phase-specific E3 ubiquitin- ligase [Paramuricea clavata]|uniref:G2 M phase-specific E3 ubiquitin- ligase n=1 Tax=Paramuricea clavata TaxID=317549 RepID=A0A6S7K9K8_PARCT|nr:G2 M phase-specific E3 ubiquitin- ligase [Paramuricea clavata]